MRLYGGIDLHSNNAYVVVLDSDGVVRYRRRLANDLGKILSALERFRCDLAGIAIESTYNGYWLIDGLQAAGHRVRLANPSAIRQYGKYSADAEDAEQLATLLRLNVLPEGYIYPASDRGIRDLLRKRLRLVQQRTSHILSLETNVARHTGRHPSWASLRRLGLDAIVGLAPDRWVRESMATSWATIVFLDDQVHRIQGTVLRELRPRPAFQALSTVPGIGRVLGPTIVLESGPIERFAGVGNYSSYCRCVSSGRYSNGKRKGRGNPKNGNKYLGWAYMEAGQLARRNCDAAARFYERKLKQTNTVVASKALAHKLARAGYHVLRDGTPFDPKRCFG